MAESTKRAAKLAKEITAFAKRHGGSADGQIAYVGHSGARISLVASDGTWGDLVAPSVGTAEKATELAGITVHDSFDGEMAGRMTTGPYEWKRMAGIQLGGAPGETPAARTGRTAPAADTKAAGTGAAKTTDAPKTGDAPRTGDAAEAADGSADSEGSAGSTRSAASTDSADSADRPAT